MTIGRDVPPMLERIVRHCLEKDPPARFQSARDVEFALESLSTTSSSSVPIVTTAGSHKIWLVAAALIAALVLLVVGFATWTGLDRSRAAVRNPLSDAQFTPLTNLQGAETDPAISPDGKFVAFISDRSGTFDIWLIQANGGSLANLTQGRIGDARAPACHRILRRWIGGVERRDARAEADALAADGRCAAQFPG
jgi:hypothetical protein